MYIYIEYWEVYSANPFPKILNTPNKGSNMNRCNTKCGLKNGQVSSGWPTRFEWCWRDWNMVNSCSWSRSWWLICHRFCQTSFDVRAKVVIICHHYETTELEMVFDEKTGTSTTMQDRWRVASSVVPSWDMGWHGFVLNRFLLKACLGNLRGYSRVYVNVIVV